MFSHFFSSLLSCIHFVKMTSFWINFNQNEWVIIVFYWMLLSRLHLFVNIFFWSACCICTILHLHLHKKCLIFPHIFRHLCTFENYHFLSPNHQQRGGSRILSRTSLYCSFIIKWAIFKFCLNHVAEISYTYTMPITTKIFKCKHVLHDLDIDYFKSKPDYTCASSPFIYYLAGHVFQV